MATDVDFGQTSPGLRPMTRFGRVTERKAMIDLHLHLLPETDDGAMSAGVTKAMLHRMHGLDYQILVATPHLVEPLRDDYRTHVEQALEDVQLLAAPLRIQVRLGYEVALTPDVPEQLARGEPITIAGSRAVLVELPFTAWPHHAETTLFSLQTAGYRPVLAHPERYVALQDDPDHGLRLVDRGLMLQVTIGSLTGLFGPRARRTAETWLRAGAVDLVATDAHSAGKRLEAVPKGLARLEQLVGAAERRRLTVETPAALLNDGMLPRPLSRDHARTSSRWYSLRQRLRATRGS